MWKTRIFTGIKKEVVEEVMCTTKLRRKARRSVSRMIMYMIGVPKLIRINTGIKIKIEVLASKKYLNMMMVQKRLIVRRFMES